MTGNYQVQVNYRISIMTMDEICRIMVVQLVLLISCIKTTVDLW
jgi:hypothetical protein